MKRATLTPLEIEYINRHLIIVGGPSGAGKTTAVRRLCERPGYIELIGSTSRPPRQGEVDGVDYHIQSRDEIAEDIDGGHALEWTEYSGHLYAYTRAEFVEPVYTGQRAIAIMTPDGVRHLRETGLNPQSVWFDTSDDVLHSRLRWRGDSAERIESRMANVEDMRAEAKAVGFDYVHISRRVYESVDLLWQMFNVAALRSGWRAEWRLMAST